jgi:hypothetical protein
MVLLLGTASLIPAYHIYEGELISLEKHLGYSVFFMMPVAGYALASLSGFRVAFSPGRYWLSGLATCLILLFVGMGVAQNMYSEWPNTNNLTTAMRTQVRTASGHYLAEQRDVLRYYTQDITLSWQWISPYYFEYTDKQGHFYQGPEAYVRAVNDGYFDLIELNFGATAELDKRIAHYIETSHKYDLIDLIPQSDSYGSGYFFIWRKR